ncbi:MAG: hypothetical protein EOO65_05215, partial [Methanosarcinales archaeon]
METSSGSIHEDTLQTDRLLAGDSEVLTGKSQLPSLHFCFCEYVLESITWVYASGFLQSYLVTLIAEGTGGLSAAAGVRSSGERKGAAHNNVPADRRVGEKWPVHPPDDGENVESVSADVVEKTPDKFRLVSGVAAPATRGVQPPKAVLVKVGRGHYSTVEFKWANMASWTRMDVLKALQASVEFRNKMKELVLDECTVTIVPSVASSVEGPTPQEEASALPLKILATVGHLADARTTGDVLFIHVRTPS